MIQVIGITIGKNYPLAVLLPACANVCQKAGCSYQEACLTYMCKMFFLSLLSMEVALSFFFFLVFRLLHVIFLIFFSSRSSWTHINLFLVLYPCLTRSTVWCATAVKKIAIAWLGQKHLQLLLQMLLDFSGYILQLSV
jgi:hypothetical protein